MVDVYTRERQLEQELAGRIEERMPGTEVLAVLQLRLLQLADDALTRLLEQPLFDVGRKLDRIDPEVAAVAVELDDRVA